MAYWAVTAAICQRPYNRCANCQSRENWTTDLWQLAQIAKWRVLAVRATVVRPLAYHGRHSTIFQRTFPTVGKVDTEL
jgi:hypothetical protein